MRSTGVMTLLIGLVATSVLAQPDSGQPPWCPEDHREQCGKMAANIENLRLLKLLETVDLSEEQSEQFIPRFHAFRKDMKELFDRRRELIHELGEQVKSDATDQDLHRSIEQLIDLRQEMEARQEEFIDSCRDILSAKQLARLVIFQERFEREILESLREFRRHGPRSMGNKR